MASELWYGMVWISMMEPSICRCAGGNWALFGVLHLLMKALLSARLASVRFRLYYQAGVSTHPLIIPFV